MMSFYAEVLSCLDPERNALTELRIIACNQLIRLVVDDSDPGFDITTYEAEGDVAGGCQRL
jgi:hypothetical protein